MIVLSLGSNLDDKEENLKTALYHLAENEKIEILKVSKIYKTSPWGDVAKGDFLNICVSIKTTLNPFSLLEYLNFIEDKMKRVRREKWGDRNIDIDIVIFNDAIIKSKKLTIPHKHFNVRNFVLYPLLDVAGDVVILEKKISQFITELSDEKIEIYKNNF